MSIVALLVTAQATQTTGDIPLPPPPAGCLSSVTIEVDKSVSPLALPTWRRLRAHTIAAAQAFAAQNGVCRLVVNLGAGVWEEAPQIDRHTAIVAVPGSAPVIRGVRADGWDVGLRGVAVVGALETGVRQNGGSLTVIGGSVKDTRPKKGTGGTGILATGGADVRVEGTFVAYNSSGAIRVSDAGTTLVVVDAEIEGNTLPDRDLVHAEASVVGVTAGAQAWIEGTTLESNEGVGLLVDGDGSTAHFRDGHLTDALDVAQTFAPMGTMWGIGAMVIGGGELEMRDFTVSNADTVGVWERDSRLRMEDGLITANRIGLTTNTMDASCAPNVLLTGNVVDQDFSEIGIPGAGDALGCLLDPAACEDAPTGAETCADVPWFE